jgi:hypothetical protein
VAVVVDGQVFHVRFERPSRGPRLILHGLPDGVGSWTAADYFHKNFHKDAGNQAHSRVFMDGQRLCGRRQRPEAKSVDDDSPAGSPNPSVN